MDTSELNLISDFASGINSLQNPSLSSQNFPLSGPTKVHQLYSFWKWGALILTFTATFCAIITRIKLLILRFCTDKWLVSSKVPQVQQLNADYDSDEDDSCSTASSEDYQEHDPTTAFRRPVNEEDDTKRWVWESQGLGLNFEEEISDSVVAIWDLNKPDQRINSFSGRRRQIPAVSTYLPGSNLSVGLNTGGNVLFGVYDTRVGGQIPAICAKWRPRRGMVVGINSVGVEKALVEDDVTAALIVGDMRNVKTPLEDLTECNGLTWWDADAVIVTTSAFTVICS